MILNNQKQRIQTTEYGDDTSSSIPRTIDTFYEEASHFNNDNALSAIRYWIFVFSMGLAHSGDAAELTSMNFVLSNEHFEHDFLNEDFKMRGSILASSIFSGMLVGGLLTGAFGDQWGRRPLLLFGLGLNTTAGILCAFVPTFSWLCIFRFFAGLGIGAIPSTVFTLATESSPPSKRGRNVAFITFFFTFGAVSIAFLAYVMFGKYDISWRVFVLFCTIPPLWGTIMVYLFVPESARYLALQNRPEEACLSANKIADAMGYQGPPLQVEEVKHYYHYPHTENSIARDDLEFSEKESKIMMRKAINAMKNIKHLYFKEIRMKTITLQLVWVSLAFGAGMTTWINVVLKKIQVSNVYLYSLYYALSSTPGNFAATILMDRLGRKFLIVMSFVCASLSLLFFSREVAVMKDATESTPWSIIFACLFHTFIVISWAAVKVMTSESFPTEVRSTGVGLCAASERFVAMLVQYVNGSLIDQPATLLIISSIAMLIGACFSCSLNDTTRNPLQDTILSDGMSISEHRGQFQDHGKAEKVNFISEEIEMVEPTAESENVVRRKSDTTNEDSLASFQRDTQMNNLV